jgi:hypothetical protein
MFFLKSTKTGNKDIVNLPFPVKNNAILSVAPLIGMARLETAYYNKLRPL